MGAIETMQKKVQQLNQHFGNSCQLAQGLINDGLDAAGYKKHSDASLIAATSGAVEDIFEAQSGDALGDAQEAAPEQVAEDDHRQYRLARAGHPERRRRAFCSAMSSCSR